MNKLYGKYLNWKLKRIFFKIENTQFFIKIHRNFDTSFDMGCTNSEYNKLDKLKIKREGLISKLNYKQRSGMILNEN